MTEADRRFLIWAAGVVVLCAFVYALRGILLPFVAGIAIAYILQPLATRLERWRLSRGAAAALLVLASVVLFAAFIFLFVPVLRDQIVGFAERLPSYADSLQTRAEKWLDVLQARLSPEDFGQLQDEMKGAAGSLLAWIGGFATGLWAGGMAVVHFLALLIITPLVAFYLLRDWDRIVAQLDDLLPAAHKADIEHLAREIDRTLSSFARGQAIVCLILAVFYATGLALIGLDFGIVIGLIIGILAFVPFVGSAIGLVLSVGLAALQFSEGTPILLTLALFVAGHILEGQILTPKIIGDSVGLHPVWVIFALLAGGALMDFVGVLLAVPIAAAIGVLVRFAVRRATALPP
jgi:predicted PurR-regulated permease PerM